MTKRSPLPLIAWAALPLTLGVVLAQTTPQRVNPVPPGQTPSTQTQSTQTPSTQTPSGQPQPGGQRGPGLSQSGTNYSDVFLQKLAAGLGLSLDRLKSAATAAATATIEQGVKAGDFPSDRATQMKQDAAQNPFMFAGHGGRGGHGGHHGMGGRGGDHDRASGGRQPGQAEAPQDDTQGRAQDSSFNF